MKKGLKRLLTWFLLLSKRLYKKVTFLMLLILIPAVVIVYSVVVDGEDSGISTVVLVQEDPADALSAQVIGALQGSSEAVRFTLAASAEEAEARVRYGKADSAWIFPADLDARIRDFIADQKHNNGFVKVIVREDNVMQMLVREKLSGEIFELCARYEYMELMRASVPAFADASDEEILAYYDSVLVEDKLFSFYQLGVGASVSDGNGYLKTPIRGLLGILIVIGGLATSMYYINDLSGGLFGWVAQRKLPGVELGYQMISMIPMGSVALLAMLGANVGTGILKELGVMLLYCLCCGSFCRMLRIWCGSIRRLGIVLPVLSVLMIAACPVFYDLAGLRGIQLLFPPTYYVNAVYNFRYVWYMLIHTLVTSGLYHLRGFLKEKGI